MKVFIALVLAVLLATSCFAAPISDLVEASKFCLENYYNSFVDEYGLTYKKDQLRFEYKGVTYYNVDKAANYVLDEDGIDDKYIPNDGTKYAYYNVDGNDDEFFPDDEEAYYLEAGVYRVSSEKFYKIIGKKFLGDGGIMYDKWRTINYTEGDTHIFTPILTVDRMNDPVYTTMLMPSEGKNFLSEFRTQSNGDTNCPPLEKHERIVPIGAIFLDTYCDLPDDTEITLCFGRIACAIKFEGQDWQVVSDQAKPSTLNKMYPLPWQLEFDANPVKINTIPKDRVVKYDDHWEITLKLSDFRALEGDDPRLNSRALHFWGKTYYFKNGQTGADIEGIACTYEVWIKEKEYEGLLLADVGADMRDKDGNVNQAFSTKAFKITTEKRSIFGHNVCTQCYDEYMDAERLIEILDLKLDLPQ